MSIFNWSTPTSGLFWEFYDRWIAPSVTQALEADLHNGVMSRVAQGARVLDLGCGGGQHAVRVATLRPDVQVEGIDNAPVMVKRARAFVERSGVQERVTIHEGDALNIAFEDSTFDVVYCAGPLKQVSDRLRVLRESYRVLKPGGELLAMDVDRGCSEKDVITFCDRTRLPRPLRPMLKVYFQNYVAAQSLDIQEAEMLWSHFAWTESDGPRAIVDHPALVMVGRKPMQVAHDSDQAVGP